MGLIEERLKKDRENRRILSIQSHVVHGYAGNKCSVFLLQLHGFEVDFINSVQFSNHTGYENGIRGYRLTDENLATLYEGLKLNNVNKYSHILSGYCGDASFLRQICAITKDLKQSNPEMCYVCDPVLGDNGKFYVPEELCEIYRNEILPLADIITPNVFELSHLSNLKIDTEAECLTAIEKLHEIRPNLRLIIATSGIFAEGRNDLFYCYTSELLSKENCSTKRFARFRFEIPVIEGNYVGTGDVFASLLIVWLNETNGDVEKSVCNVIASLQVLLKRTHAASYKACDKPNAAQREIRLIQSRFDFLSPQEQVKYTKL